MPKFNVLVLLGLYTHVTANCFKVYKLCCDGRVVKASDQGRR